MPRIVFEGVSKSYAGAGAKTVMAVDHLSLEINPGELLALVGPSGCGKTTTLRLLAGLESADAGRILFDDRLVTAQPPGERDVAMVFQSAALFPHFTVFDNLAFGLKLRHVSRAEMAARVHETAELLGVAQLLARRPGQLSGGESQRVALGRALVRRPQVLLLDEPLSHLDEPLRVQLRSELLAIQSRLELTMVYVTHDQAEALAVGDRVAVLRAGKLQQTGPPREIYEAPANAFVAGFIGSPPMNLIRGTVAETGDGLVLRDDPSNSGATTLPAVLSCGHWRADWFSRNRGRPVLFGIRPEHIHIATEPSPAGDSPALTGVVQSLQFSGNETLVRLAVGAQLIAARAEASPAWQRGQQVSLVFDWRHARIYDPAVGAEIF